MNTLNHKIEFKMKKEIRAWENNYQKGRYNNWPYDILVSIIMRFYGNKIRNQIKILDLGCGGGNNTYFLAKEGFNTFAVDGAPTSIEITREKLSRENLSVKAKVANFKDLPFKNGLFDCVVDRASIYCNIWNDILLIFKEIKRVLKKGGRYIGFLPNLKHPAKKYGKEFEKNTYTNFKQGTYSHSEITHFFSKNEIFILLKDFKIEEFLEHKIENLRNKESKLNFSEYIVVGKK